MRHSRIVGRNVSKVTDAGANDYNRFYTPTSLDGDGVLAHKSVGSRSPFIRNNRTRRPRPWTRHWSHGAPRLKGVEKIRISLTQPRPMDCRGSGRATFVAVMQAADLRKCDDLASRMRLDAAGVRTIFV
jgi:hypothetical protein